MTAAETNIPRKSSDRIVGMQTTSHKFEIGDTAYIVEHCPEPPADQDPNSDDLTWWEHDHSESVVFASLPKAISFTRKVVKTSMFGEVDIYEAVLTNPYRDEYPDWMVKRSALVWKKVEGGYECAIRR